MMNRRLLGGILAAVGLLLLVVSVFADASSIGEDEGFGGQQTTGAVVGAVVLVVGLAVRYIPRRGEALPQADE